MNFDLQPTLIGDILKLRPLQISDFDDLFAVVKDPLIWEQHPVKDRYKKEVFEILFQESIASGGALVAIDNNDGKIIGSSRYHGYDRNKSEIEIGWTFLARPYWGGKYNKEMKRLMLDHAFKFVDSILFIVGVDNIRSQKAVEKIGGVYIESQPDAGGNDSLVYQITRRRFIDNW